MFGIEMKEPDLGPSRLAEAFLENRRRCIHVLGDELGFVPFTEQSRKQGLGEVLPAFTSSLREQADRLATAGRAPAMAGRIPIQAAAFAATGEERYAESAQRCYLDWIATHPTRKEYSWDDLAHGLYAWLGPLHLLLQSRAFDTETVEKVIGAARDWMGWLAQEIYPARNLRITSAAALLNNGLRLAFLPEARRWIDQGSRIMPDAMQRQIMPDGSHLEATPHYHFCSMGDILNVYRKFRLLPELGINIPAEHVARMFDYLAAATGPTGFITGIHDGPCEATTGLHGQGVADVLEERNQFRRSISLPDSPMPTVRLFPHAGQIYIRENWSSDAVYLTFEASPCRSYHWHPARNSVQLRAYGRMLLADPGRFSYSDRAWGEYGHRTRSHSTINLNGWDQAETEATLRHRAAPGYDVIEGCYKGGYWPGKRIEGHGQGIYAEHHRTLLWIRDRCIVVLDHLYCPSEPGRKPSIESVWQFTEGALEVQPEKRYACTNNPDANLLMLLPLQPEGAQMAVHEGQKEPLRGWLPKQFETEFIPAPQLVVSAGRLEPWNTHFAIVLIPYRGELRPEVAVEKVVDPEHNADFLRPGYGMIVLRWADGTTDELLWTRRMEFALNDRENIVTDASLVHVQKNAGGILVRGLVVDGTYIEPYAPQKRIRPETFSFSL